MAVLFGGNGYGQVEPNRCSFLHDGNIESQCVATTALENGTIVVVEKAGPTTFTDKNGATVTTDAGSVAPATALSGLIGLNYTAERIYERATGLKNFRVEAGEYPRVGYLKKGDVYTTNAVAEGSYTKATLESAIATGLYVTAAGTLATESSGDIALKVVELTTMPDGQPAVKIQVI